MTLDKLFLNREWWKGPPADAKPDIFIHRKVLEPLKRAVGPGLDTVQGVPGTFVGTLDQDFRFSTKRYDEGSGLSYYGYRFYSPLLGRWLTRDPIGELGGANLYAFVNNDPVNRVDTVGRKSDPSTSRSCRSSTPT